MLERYFKLREHNTNAGVEVLAGVTTFMTMAYILVVNPDILSATGMPREALFTATAVATIFATVLMAFWANMPFALAPGMGINVFFAFIIVQAKGYTWQQALTAVFVAGIIFLVLSLAGVREALVNSIPDGLKAAIGVSIGLMIAGIGLKNAGVIKAGGAMLQLGDIKHGTALVALIGIAITAILMALKFKSGILLGIVITTIIGIFVAVPGAEGMVTNYAALAENGAFTTPPSISEIAFAFDFAADKLFTVDFLIVVFTLLFVDIFDSLGTFLGVLSRVGVKTGNYDQRIPKALMCDAVGTIAGACLGTSTVTTYAESSAGISAGGRTGLTALVTGICFVIALFFSNLFLIVPSAATAAAMVIVGMYLAAAAINIDFDDYAVGVPAIVTIMVTTLTCSISDGLMFGWLALVVIKLFSGRARELNAITVIFALVFLAKIAFT